MNQRSWTHPVLLALLASCAAEDDEGAAELEQIEQAIEVGTNDVSNPVTNAVVRVGGRCTGTLIAPNIVLTAASCGFTDAAFADGAWHALPSAVNIEFGPRRGEPIHRARATRVSTPPLAPTPWPEDIALLQLSTNVARSIAVPRAVAIDEPYLPYSTIYQVGYGGGRDRRVMTGRDYAERTSDGPLLANGFVYTPDERGMGIGDRDTNIEAGDGGGPMLYDSPTGPVFGVLSHWAPYGIATFGRGQGSSCTTRCTAPDRPSIRDWLNAKVPQAADFRVVSIEPDGCTLSGLHKVEVTVANDGGRTGNADIDLFANRTSIPPLSTMLTPIAQGSAYNTPGSTTLNRVLLAGTPGTAGYAVLVDRRGEGGDVNLSNNSLLRRITLPTCTIRPAARQLRFRFENGADGARAGHTIQAEMWTSDEVLLRSPRFDGGANWPARSTRTVTWDLPEAVELDEIMSIHIVFEGGDCPGCGPDRWILDGLTIEVSQPSASVVTLAREENLSFDGSAHHYISIFK